MKKPNLSKNAQQLKAAGVSLPNHPTNANAAAKSMIDNVKSGKSAEVLSKGNEDSVESNRKKNFTRHAGTSIALNKERKPLQTLKNKGIPHSVEEEEDRKVVREWCRIFYANHNLMSTAIDIYTHFPIQGLEITSKDPEIKKFYETLFFDQLNYESFLENFGREFWTVGEVNAIANWNETLGIWDDDQIINPNDVVVQRSSLFNTGENYWMQIPESIKEIIRSGEPSWEYKKLQEEYPEIFAAAQGSTNSLQGVGITNREGNDQHQGLLAVSSHVLSRAINEVTPWDTYGTPHMMRAFNTLMMEESLNAAQDAVADRLYSPMILAKLGSENGLGDGKGAWIPDDEELDAFTSQMNSAFAADFRFLAYHFGIDIKSVFGKESLPNFDKDYDRLERKMLQVWGIGEGLISGSSNGSYASSALNREFVTQLMSAFQKKIVDHFKKRCEIVAEAQEHWDYESNNGIRVPIYEEVVERDEETGEQYVTKRPKLLLPELKFKTMNLRDEAQERTFLQTLKSAGIPVSDGAFMTNIELEFDDELEQIKAEKMAKIIAEQEMKVETYKALMARGLPVPAELEAEMAKLQTPDDPSTPQDESGLPGEQGRPDEGLPGEQGRPDSNLPGEQGRPQELPGTQGRPAELPGVAGRPQIGGKDRVKGLPNAQGRPGGNLPGSQGRPKAAGIEFTDESDEPTSSDGAIPDITSPVTTPNLAPNDDAAEDSSGEGESEGGSEGSKGFESLPRNEIKQRPEISDEQRSNAPKKSGLRNGPSTVGIRSKLHPDTVKAAISQRRWTNSINNKPKVD